MKVLAFCWAAALNRILRLIIKDVAAFLFFFLPIFAFFMCGCKDLPHLAHCSFAKWFGTIPFPLECVR